MDNTLVCYECSKALVKKHADLEFGHPVVGSYTVKSVINYQCEKCGDRVVPPHEARRIEKTGAKLHLLAYLNKNGKQPFQTIKTAMLCDESLLLEVLSEVVKEKKVEKIQQGELEIYKLTMELEDPKFKNIWDKLKSIFKGM